MCISCTSHQFIIVNNSSLTYKIGKVKLVQIDKKKYDELLAPGKNLKTSGISAFTLYYASKDGKILAYKSFMEAPFTHSFAERYVNMKGFYGSLEFGTGFIAADSVSIGQNWIYAIKFKAKQTLEDKNWSRLCFRIESNHVRMAIVTDFRHEAIAKRLLDVLTMETMNVKLHMKTEAKFRNNLKWNR